MKLLVAFDLDGTLAESKQPLQPAMGNALSDLLAVMHVAVISGGNWPQFEKQVASRLKRSLLSPLLLRAQNSSSAFSLPPTSFGRHLSSASG